MNTNPYNRCSYAELRAAATAPGAAQIDIDTLGAWLADYDPSSWNGEYYDADGLRLFPVYDWDEELDQGELTGYEIR